jgi:hypothetical protein
VPIRWVVAEEDAAKAIRELLLDADLTEVEVKHVPIGR